MFPAMEALMERPPAGAREAAAALPLPQSEAEAEEAVPRLPVDRAPTDTVKIATVAATGAVAISRPVSRLSPLTLTATAATALERMAPGVGTDTLPVTLDLLVLTGIAPR